MSDAFNELMKINVNEHIDKKGNLSYLPWAFAWGELKKRYPNSFYTIYENRDGWFYHTDGRTCWVKTGVTLVDGDYQMEHVETLAVMNAQNRSILLNAVTSFDVMKSIQRCLTKACARHGLGLYVYAGEDLPDDPELNLSKQKPSAGHSAPPTQNPPTVQKPTQPTSAQPPRKMICVSCHKEIGGITFKSGNQMTAEQVNAMSKERAGASMCYACYKAWNKQNGGMTA